MNSTKESAAQPATKQESGAIATPLLRPLENLERRLGIVAYLVAGGMSEAEAAAAVKPLIGKRILAVADVAAHPS